MKKIGLVLFTVLLGTIVTDSTLAQDNNTGVVMETLDGFETPDAWDIKFSSQRCQKWESDFIDMGSETTSPGEGAQPQPVAGNAQDDNKWIKWFNVESFPIEFRSTILHQGIPTNQKEAEKNIVGIKGCWINPGFNWVAIEPKNPIYTQSNPLAISLWAWSTNYNYDLYITVKNERGFFYTFYMGNLNYYGWRQLKVNIPGYVFPKSNLAKNKLQVIRVKVVGNLVEEYQGFYAYFDLLQVLHGNNHASYSGNALSQNKW